MSLRLKILSGFIILAIMLFVAGIWSIHELNTMGSSVQRLLDEDFKSMNAAMQMIEALEREDSGSLLLFLGNWEEGRAIIASGDSLFEQMYQQAQRQDELSGEKEYLESIRVSYEAYKDLWEKPIVGTDREGNLTWYFQELHKAFLDVKSSVNDLLAYNDQIMYRTATNLRNRSNRAIMPGIIAVGAALLFTMIFNFFVNFYVISPLVKIRDAVNQFIERKIPYNVELETSDEIGDLALSIGRLCMRIDPEEPRK